MEKQRFNSKIKHHSKKLNEESEKIRDKIRDNLIIDQAPKRKLIKWITIDWNWTRVRDDWIYAEETNSWYSIFESIIDTSEIILKDSPLDIEAKKRIQTIYFNTHSFQLFPENLAINEISLNNKTKRLSQTTRIDLDKNFKIIDSEIFESIFYNEKAFNYNDFEEHYNNPESKYYKQLHLLEKIANWLKFNREKWIKTNFRECITLNFDSGCKKEIKTIWQEIVSEFALAKNIEDAKIAYKEKILLIFRWHRPDLKNYFLWNNNDLWKSFYTYKPTFHFWLQENFVTSVTSPSRFYPALVNQRQQKSWVRKDMPEYNLNQIRENSFIINTNIKRNLNYQKNHNNQVNKLRIQRLIKMLKKDNFENIWSLEQKTFHYMLKYFINYESSYLTDPIIWAEIIYRIQNNFLNKNTLWLIKSTPKTIKEINIFKEIINQKEQEEMLY